MPKFLNHLDLNGNQLKNTKLEITDSPLAEEGVIHYHDTNNTVRYHNGVGFITLGDNDTATTSAAGISKLRYSVGATPAAQAQTTTASRTYGVTANSSDQLVVNVPWVDTNTDTNTQRSAGTGMSLSTNTLNVNVGATGTTQAPQSITTTASRLYQVETDDQDNLVVNVPWSDTDTNTQLSTTGVTGMALTNLDATSGGTLAATDSILAAFGKLENRVALNDVKVTNSTIAARSAGTGMSLSTNTLNINVDGTNTVAANNSSSTASRTYKVQVDGSDNLVVNVPWADTTIANTDVDVSKDNLETRLGEIDSNVTIGNASSVDTTISGDLTVTGDLLVSGATTTLDVATLEVEDLNITVAKGAASATAADGAGLTVDGASATLLYRSTGDKFVFNKALEATSFSGALTLTDLDIDGGTALGAAPDGTDLLIVDDGANGTNKSMTVANLQSYMQNALTFIANTDTIDMGDGFVVSADTNTAVTTITESDTLTISGGTGISTVSNPDGTITITNDVVNTNTNQLTTFNIGVDTDTNTTVIAHNETLTFTGGTGISTETTADGTITFTNTSPNVTQTTITGNAGSATVLEDGAVGGVKVFHLDNADGDVAADQGNADSTIFTITHGMGNSRFYKVEVVLDSGDYDTVYADVQRPSDATVKITFGAAVANGAYRAMLTRMA
jgi:hypothetical protein